MESGQQFGLYVIRGVIEAGENQSFYCAEDPFFNREVTLKLFPIDQFSDEQSVEQLEERLERLAVLDQVSIAPIYDSGNEDGYFYYTSVFFDNDSLSLRLNTAAIEDKAALNILLELTEALEYARQQEVELSLPSAEGICFDSSGHAVIADLGVNDLVNRLASGKQERTVDNEEQLRALGMLLLQMVLGPQFNPAGQPESQLSLVTNDRVKQLLGRFLLPEEWSFESYAELLTELHSYAEVDSQPESRVEVEPLKNDQDAPEQNQTDKMIADVRQLVAEKNRLQQSLDEALYDRGQVEKKLKDGEHQLQLAQNEIIRVKEEANVAWELVAGKKYDRWRPVIWAAGGFIVGFLLSGGYGYYYSEQTRNELLAKLQKNEELIKSAGWNKSKSDKQQAVEDVAAAPASMKDEVVSTDKAADAPTEPAIAQTEQAPVVAEAPQSWWPAGSEFSAAAAIPMEKIKSAFGLNSQDTKHSLPGILRQEVMETVRSWATSWSRQDLEGYFSFYSSGYRPELGRSQEEWRKIRTSRVTRPKWIEVDIEDLQLRQISEDRIQVKLKQIYRSDFYQDQILKSINLIKENGEWRILMERSLGFLELSPGDIVGG